MASRLIKPVVLVGMMGAGKTAIGSALARMLDVALLDSDQELVAAANMTIAEIFERDGEAFFRRRETEVIQRLISSEPSVISTGGGAFMSAKNRQMIAESAVSVWLKADLNLLWERVRHKTTRPLLLNDRPYETLAEIFEERVPIYAKADIAVEADATYSIDQMTAKVHAALERAGHIEKAKDD